ncbi:hypothetical protein OS493_010615, partial [Desmophyllum pertusum]
MLEICLARDYIISFLTIKTGNSPGALANATINDFNIVSSDTNTRYRVMLIPDHKCGVAGPAPVTLDAELYKQLDSYLRYIHPQFGPSRENKIFLTNDGKAFENGTLSKRLPEFWARSGVRPDLRVTTTNLKVDCD